ncbi:hypothetical protein Tco_0328868 [Tanacetum coccineum]
MEKYIRDQVKIIIRYILFDILACSVSRSNSVREGANTNTRKRDWKLAIITFGKVKIPSTGKRRRHSILDTCTSTECSSLQRRPCVETQSSLENTITHSSVQEAPSNGKGIAGFDFVDGDDRLDQPADIDVVYVLLREIIGFDSLISILKLRGTTYSFTQQKAFQCIGDLIYGHRQKLDVFASKSLGNKREVEPALNSIW